MSDVSKFMAGSLLSLSAMVQLEVPHINILSKCDLADSQEVILPIRKSYAQATALAISFSFLSNLLRMTILRRYLVSLIVIQLLY